MLILKKISDITPIKTIALHEAKKPQTNSITNLTKTLLLFLLLDKKITILYKRKEFIKFFNAL